MKNAVYCLILILIFIMHTACSGGECAATSDFLTDIDSDCIDDDSDNCVGWYNPHQFDGDDDGIGAACDSDDTDSSVAAVAWIEEPEADMMGHYALLNKRQSIHDSVYLLTQSSCPDQDHVLEIDPKTIALDDKQTFQQGHHKEKTATCQFVYQPFKNKIFCTHNTQDCISFYEAKNY